MEAFETHCYHKSVKIRHTRKMSRMKLLRRVRQDRALFDGVMSRHCNGVVYCHFTLTLFRFYGDVFVILDVRQPTSQCRTSTNIQTRRR